MRENIRHGYAPGRHFGSPAERQAYVDRFELARETARRLGLRYVVAPDCSLTSADGRVLYDGDEVRITDFAHVRRHVHGESIRDVPPWRQLERAVLDGRVIDSGYEPEPPRAA